MQNFTKTYNHLMAAALLLLATTAFAQPTFINKIPIPPVIDANDGTILLEMRKNFHKFNPAVPSDTLNGGINQPNGITTFGYNKAGDSTLTILGPTLRWHANSDVTIMVHNLIGEPTTTHWHGAEVPPHMDGGPHSPIMPNSTWMVQFPVLDKASTMWYHPHYHDHTLEQVQMGLSGMIYVEDASDPIRNTLPHTYGVDDIPVIIGDLGVSRNNNLGLILVDTVKSKRPLNLVNGVTNPYLEVPAHWVRLRVLNGSTRKGVKFGIADAYGAPLSALKDFYLIATDGGYTLEPNKQRAILNGPGARDEIMIDLSGYAPGQKLYLQNLNQELPGYVVGSPQPGPYGGGSDPTIGKAFLELRIVADSNFPGYVPVNNPPSFTTNWEQALQDTSNIVKHRTKNLVKEPHFTIDGTTYSMTTINDTVCVDTKEIWTVHNKTKVAHPFHIHKIQFRVLDIDSMGTMIDLVERGFNGPKDDVFVLPNWKLRFMGYFNDYPSEPTFDHGYMYHCHILTHEDSIGGGMMHQFVVTDQGQCISGVETENLMPTMSLFPNPTDGVLYLHGQSMGNSMVRVLDAQGRFLRDQRLTPFDGDAALNMQGLTPGMYFVEWRTQYGTATSKVILR